jgi:hypothetical protein
VIVCVPTLRVETPTSACPEPFTVTPEARVVVPSRKLTVPVGIPEPGETALTVAVKVTSSPKTDAFGDVLTTVVVEA